MSDKAIEEPSQAAAGPKRRRAAAIIWFAGDSGRRARAGWSPETAASILPRRMSR